MKAAIQTLAASFITACVLVGALAAIEILNSHGGK